MIKKLNSSTNPLKNLKRENVKSTLSSRTVRKISNLKLKNKPNN